MAEGIGSLVQAAGLIVSLIGAWWCGKTRIS
jgi:hypothetical protein